MDNTIALIRKSHDGDKKAREELVERNIGLVWCVVKRFYGRGAEPEDLLCNQQKQFWTFQNHFIIKLMEKVEWLICQHN